MSKKAAENNELPDLLALRVAQLEPFGPYLYGNRLASILVIKGVRGTVEEAGQPPFFGDDGTALESAFVALGWGANNWCGVLLNPQGVLALTAKQLRLLIEIVDPLAVVALDGVAARMLVAGFEKALLKEKLKTGKKTDVLGRPFLVTDDFEAALNNKQRKQLVWSQLKALKKS